MHIIINPSLSAAIGYNLFLNPPNVAEVTAILELANSTPTDYSSLNGLEKYILNIRLILF